MATSKPRSKNVATPQNLIRDITQLLQTRGLRYGAHRGDVAPWIGGTAGNFIKGPNAMGGAYTDQFQIQVTELIASGTAGTPATSVAPTAPAYTDVEDTYVVTMFISKAYFEKDGEMAYGSDHSVVPDPTRI